MATEEITLQLATQIAEIIRKVGRREDVVDKVANTVDFGELANRLMGEEGPVRDTAVKVVVKFLRDLEIESGDDTSQKILEAMDFESLLKGMSDDPDIRESFRGAVKNALENLSDDEDFPDKVYQALHFDDAEKCLEQMSPEDRAEVLKAVSAKVLEYLKENDFTEGNDDIQAAIENAAFSEERIAACLAEHQAEILKAVAAKVLDYIKEKDLADCSDDIQAAIENAAFSEERIVACLAGHQDEISQKLWETIEGMFGTDPSHDVSERIRNAVFESEAFKRAMDTATERLIREGRVERLVEEAAKAMLTDKDTALRRRLQETISSKLVDRIAGSVVDRLFDPQTARR